MPEFVCVWCAEIKPQMELLHTGDWTRGICEGCVTQLVWHRNNITARAQPATR